MFDFRRYWHSFLERIWIVAICVLAGLFLALGNLARTPKLYQAHTVLEVEFQEPSFVPTNDSTTRTRSVFLASQEALRTIEQNLTNQTLLARVVRSEGLAQDGGRALLGQSVVADKSSSATERTEPSQAANKTQNASGVTTFTPLEEALGRGMVGMVHPVIRRGTRLIDLYVTHGDPAMAQRLAEAVGREYIRNSIERRASSSEDALRYLLEEEERLKRNLQKSEAAANEYKAKNPDALQLGGGTAATGSQGAGGSKGGLVEDNLQDINTKLAAARADQIRLEGQLQQVDQIGNNIDALLAIPSISAAPMVTDARSNIIQIEASDHHPRLTIQGQAPQNDGGQGLAGRGERQAPSSGLGATSASAQYDRANQSDRGQLATSFARPAGRRGQSQPHRDRLSGIGAASRNRSCVVRKRPSPDKRHEPGKRRQGECGQRD